MSAAGPQRVTKQSATRRQVLDLIERLGVGNAIPSERQLSADLGVSRLTVRAALGVPLHSPAFLFERTSRDDEGRTVEFVQSVYRGDRYRIVTELNRPAS